ncbi:Caltractin ICL1f [Symbiodinium microadriaticum]|uniref:Caltractin ICL1f n=2 Tax=Symbiodinium TaxID=2949 RepID=A0A1Q9C500_SYMMI|nr:Caltractin ICL1f [Symbiodinium microadriaticum]
MMRDRVLERLKPLRAMGNIIDNNLCCARSAKVKVELDRFKNRLEACNKKLDALVQEEINDIFGQVDVDGSQALDLKEAKALVGKLEESGFEFPSDVSTFDQDGDGNISRTEVSLAVRAALRERPKNLELLSSKCEDVDLLSRDAWDLIDVTKDGYISIPELSMFYGDLGKVMDEKPPTYQELLELAKKYDTDSDSVLTYEEFELFFVDYLCRTCFKPEEFEVQDSASTDLVHWQRELADNLQAVLKDRLETLLESLAAAVPEVHEKFKLESGVPVRTGAKAKASDKAFKKKRSSSRISSRVSTISLTSKPGTRLLDDWSEAFVVSEQEATSIYNELYGERASEGERAFSSIQSMREFSSAFPLDVQISDLQVCLLSVDILVLFGIQVMISVFFQWPGPFEVKRTFHAAKHPKSKFGGIYTNLRDDDDLDCVGEVMLLHKYRERELDHIHLCHAVVIAFTVMSSGTRYGEKSASIKLVQSFRDDEIFALVLTDSFTELRRWLQKREAPGRLMRRLSYKFTRAVLHCSLTPEHVDSDAMVEESTGENDVLTTSLLQSVSGGKASSMEVVSSFTTSDIYSTHSTAPGQGQDKVDRSDKQHPAASGWVEDTTANVKKSMSDHFNRNLAVVERKCEVQIDEYRVYVIALGCDLGDRLLPFNNGSFLFDCTGSGTSALIQQETWLAVLSSGVGVQVLVAQITYAVRLLATFQPHKVPCWERLSPKDADDCVSHTQLADLVNMFQRFIPELRGDGIYAQLHFQVVGRCTYFDDDDDDDEFDDDDDDDDFSHLNVEFRMLTKQTEQVPTGTGLQWSFEAVAGSRHLVAAGSGRLLVLEPPPRGRKLRTSTGDLGPLTFLAGTGEHAVSGPPPPTILMPVAPSTCSSAGRGASSKGNDDVLDLTGPDEVPDSEDPAKLGSPTDKDQDIDVGSNVVICGGSRPHLIGAKTMVLPAAAGAASFLGEDSSRSIVLTDNRHDRRGRVLTVDTAHLRLAARRHFLGDDGLHASPDCRDLSGHCLLQVWFLHYTGRNDQGAGEVRNQTTTRESAKPKPKRRPLPSAREGPGNAATEGPAISGNDDAEAERLNVPTVPEAATPAPDTQEGTPRVPEMPQTMPTDPGPSVPAQAISNLEAVATGRRSKQKKQNDLPLWYRRMRKQRAKNNAGRQHIPAPRRPTKRPEWLLPMDEDDLRPTSVQSSRRLQRPPASAAYPRMNAD